MKKRPAKAKRPAAPRPPRKARPAPKQNPPLRSPGLPPSPRYLDRTIQVVLLHTPSQTVLCRGPLLSAAEASYLAGPIDVPGEGGDVTDEFSVGFLPAEGVELPGYRWEPRVSRWVPADFVWSDADWAFVAPARIKRLQAMARAEPKEAEASDA